MIRCFLTTTARVTPWSPYALSNFLRIVKAAERNTENCLARSPEDADLIVFVEPGRRFQSDVACSPLYRAYRQKSVVMDFSDNPWPRIPGLYVGLNRNHLSTPLFQSGFYLRVAENQLFEQFEKDPPRPDLLFSFLGRSVNCPAVRLPLLRIEHPRSVIGDRSSNQSDDDPNYVETIYRSKFVLCPRGFGPSSWRLFETLRAGRVPVIISDAWVPPRGVEWPKISLRVKESDIEAIPELLERLEPESLDMGKMARREWERCFSIDRCFSWVSCRLREVLPKSNEDRLPLRKLLFHHVGLNNLAEIMRDELAVRLLSR